MIDRIVSLAERSMSFALDCLLRLASPGRWRYFLHRVKGVLFPPPSSAETTTFLLFIQAKAGKSYEARIEEAIDAYRTQMGEPWNC